MQPRETSPPPLRLRARGLLCASLTALALHCLHLPWLLLHWLLLPWLLLMVPTSYRQTRGNVSGPCRQQDHSPDHAHRARPQLARFHNSYLLHTASTGLAITGVHWPWRHWRPLALALGCDYKAAADLSHSVSVWPGAHASRARPKPRAVALS